MKKQQQAKKKTVEKQEFKHWNKVWIALIAILVFVIFSGCLSNEFTNWDDDTIVLKSPYLQDFQKNGISVFLNATHDLLVRNPLTLLSHSITYKLYGENPFPYHLINLLLHLLNSVLVFIFLKKLKLSNAIAGFACLIFALHPMRVESVAWVAERKDVLFAFFFISSLIAYQSYIQSKKIWYLALSILLYVPGYFSKFSAITLPFAILLLDYWYSRNDYKKIIIEKIPFFIIMISLAILEFSSQISQSVSGNETTAYSFVQRIFFASYSFTFYLVKSIAPVYNNAMYVYPTGKLPTEYYLSIIAAIGFIAFYIWIILKNPASKRLLIFGGLFFLVNIGLVMHIIPFGGRVIAADRYTYIPHMGLALIIAHVLINLKETAFGRKNATVTALILPAILVFFVVVTVTRIPVWKNSVSLFTDVVEKNPNIAMAWNNLGLAQYDTGDFENALKNTSKAVELDKNYAEAYYNIGNIKYKQKNYTDALKYFDKAIEKRFNFEWAWYNKANTLAEQMKFTQAIPCYAMATKINPVFADAYTNLGNSYAAIRCYQKSIDNFNQTIKLRPGEHVCIKNRGISKFYLGDKQGACEDWIKAQSMGNPDVSEAIKLHCQ